MELEKYMEMVETAVDMIPGMTDLPVAPAGASYYFIQDPDGQQFAVFHDVPIFDEHVAKDGTVYTPELLSDIASNCNMRVADTGDMCPIVERHTHRDPTQPQPEIIGYAKDFSVQTLGYVDPRQCIFATFLIYVDRLQYFLRHPRRSVEVWKGKETSNRFFDPIAVLGAECPKRDLGMVRYSLREHDGETLEVEHYSVPVAPGMTNTAPLSTEGPKKKETYEEEDMTVNSEGPTISDEMKGQVIEWLKPTIQDAVQEVFTGLMNGENTAEAEMNAEVAEEAAVEDSLEAAETAEEILEEEPAGEVAGSEPETDAAEGDNTPVGETEDEEEDVDEKPEKNSRELASDVDESQEKYEKVDCSDQYALDRGRHVFAKIKEKYGEDLAGGKAYMESLDSEDRSALETYAACDVCSAEDKESYEAYACFGKEDEEKESYARESSEEAVQEHYKREIADMQEKYQRLESERDELNERYSRAMSENSDLKDQLTESRKAERYSKIEKSLTEMVSDGFKLDVEKEAKFCATMNEEDCKYHMEVRIPELYKRAPIDPLLPVEETLDIPSERAEELSMEERENYSKAAREVILNRGPDSSISGPDSYKKVFTWMCENGSTDYPEQPSA